MDSWRKLNGVDSQVYCSDVREKVDAEARLANAQAFESATEAVNAHRKLQIAKLKREQYCASAERTRRLLEA